MEDANPVRKSVVEKLAKLGKHSLEPLIRNLDRMSETQVVSPDASTIIEALGVIKDRRAVESLIRFLQILTPGDHDDLIVKVAEVLGELGDPRGGEALIPFLSTVHDETRYRIEWALSRIKIP